MISSDYSYPTIEAYPHGDDFILFQNLSNKLYVLNQTGRYVWEQLRVTKNPASIAENYSSYFSVSYPQAIEDVHTCLGQWKEAGLFANPETIQPLEAQAHPFFTEKSADHLIKTDQQCHLHDTFILAGKTMQVNFCDNELQNLFQYFFPHLIVTKVERPDLTVSLWKENEAIYAEINDQRMHTTGTLDILLSWIVAEFVDKTYRSSNCLAVLHAGAVGFQDKGIILAGKSGSGKSTLTAALQQDGFTYLCDDVCPLASENGALVPVPMSQSLKKGSWEILAEICPSLERQISVHAKQTKIKYLPPQSGNTTDWNKKWQVSTLLFPHYQPNIETEFTSIPPISALSFLINSGSLCGDSIPNFLAWIETKQCYTLTYSSLQDATRTIKENHL